MLIPKNLVFDQGLGDLFVIRVAGNIEGLPLNVPSLLLLRPLMNQSMPNSRPSVSVTSASRTSTRTWRRTTSSFFSASRTTS